jgi:hypothetical protein
VEEVLVVVLQIFFGVVIQFLGWWPLDVSTGSDAAVVHLPATPPLADLAACERAEPDEVGGRPVVLSPRGAYFAATAADKLAVFYPANRKAGDRVTGTVRIDFGSNPLPFERVLRDVFLEVLADEGADLPELAKWEARYPDSAMYLSGSLSPESFARVVGAFAFPHACGPDPWYFDAVKATVEDVRQATKGANPDKTALWHARGSPRGRGGGYRARVGRSRPTSRRRGPR